VTSTKSGFPASFHVTGQEGLCVKKGSMKTVTSPQETLKLE